MILDAHKGIVSCLCVLPNNKLASCSWDKTIKIWDLINYNEIKTLTGHSGIVYSICVQNGTKLLG